MTEVVAALIVRDGRILICQRPAGKARANLWEFVGGKVEPGETREQALKRECLEEMDVRISVGNPAFDVVHVYPDLSIHLYLYYASIVSGEPKRLEHQDMRWIRPCELTDYPFCPADDEMIKKIIEGDQSMEEVYSFLKKAGTYYLATVEDGKPFVRPFGTIDLFEGHLYIQTGKVKRVYRQLAANPNYEICAFTDGTWIRLSGRAVEDDRSEARVHMLDAYPELKRMYQPDDGNTVVFRLEQSVATFCSFTSEPKTILIP